MFIIPHQRLVYTLLQYGKRIMEYTHHQYFLIQNQLDRIMELLTLNLLMATKHSRL